MATKKLEVIIAGDGKGAAGAFGDVEKSAEGMTGKLQGVASKLGPMFAVAGVAAGAALVKGIMDSFQIDGLTSKMEAELGVTEARAGELGSAAADAYAAGFGGSLDDTFAAASAVQTAFGDSIAGADLEPLIGQATTLADVFGLDVNEAMLSAGGLLKNGLVGDGQEALDLLTVGLQGLAPSVRDEILAATNEYGKHFAALGISGEEAFAMFRAADGVIGVDKLGDALKELTIRGTDMSTGSVAAFDAMGLSAEDMSGKLLAGGDTARGAMDQIVEGLLGIEDPTAQANAAIALFGTPLEDLGTDKIPQFLEGLQGMGSGLGDIDGKAQEMADSINSGPAAAIERFKREVLMKFTDFAGNVVIPAIESLVGWFSENKWAIGPLAAAVGTVLVGAFIAWAWSAGAAAVATLSAALPVIALVLAIGLLAAGLVWAYQNVDWFRNAVDAVARFLVDTVWPALQQVAAYLIEGFTQAWQWGSAAVGWLIEKGTEFWNFFQTSILPILQAVASFLVDVFTAAWSVGSAAVGWVIEKGTELWNFFSANVLPILQSVAGYLAEGFSVAWQAGSTAVGWIIEKGGELWDSFNTNVLPVLQDVAGYIEGGFTTAFNAGKAAIGFVVERAKDLWNALNDVIDMARDVASAISNLPGAGVVKGIAGAFPGFAAGGTPPVGTPYWVGENGPELRIDKRPGVIIPNHRVRDYAATGGRAAGGGDTYVVQIHNAGSVLAERELVDVVADGLERARRRTGRSLVVGR